MSTQNKVVAEFIMESIVEKVEASTPEINKPMSQKPAGITAFTKYKKASSGKIFCPSYLIFNKWAAATPVAIVKRNSEF